MVIFIWQTKFVHVNRKFAVEYVTKKLAMGMNTENFSHDQIGLNLNKVCLTKKMFRLQYECGARVIYLLTSVRQTVNYFSQESIDSNKKIGEKCIYFLYIPPNIIHTCGKARKQCWP